VDQLRALALESVIELANARRQVRQAEAELAEATEEIRRILADESKPYQDLLTAAQAEEESLKAMAVDMIEIFEAARTLELLDGVEVARLAMPSGVALKWVETLDVSAEDLDIKYLKTAPDMIKVKEAIKAGAKVEGVTVRRVPQIQVSK
jgi:hypothetical protein